MLHPKHALPLALSAVMGCATTAPLATKTDLASLNARAETTNAEVSGRLEEVQKSQADLTAAVEGLRAEMARASNVIHGEGVNDWKARFDAERMRKAQEVVKGALAGLNKNPTCGDVRKAIEKALEPFGPFIEPKGDYRSTNQPDHYRFTPLDRGMIELHFFGDSSTGERTSYHVSGGEYMLHDDPLPKKLEPPDFPDLYLQGQCSDRPRGEERERLRPRQKDGRR